MKRHKGPDFVEVVCILIIVIVFFFGVLIGKAAGALSQASWYGPGLYGNTTACGTTLGTNTWGVAHRYLPCGSRIRVCWSMRCAYVRVIDRGPFVAGRDLDLTWPVASYLCRCRYWGVRLVAWERS